MSDNLKQKVCLQIKVWWSTHPLIHFFIQLQLPTFVSALGLEIFQFYFHNTAKTNNKQKHLLKWVLLKIYEFSDTVQEKFYVCYIFMYLHNSFCFFLKLVLSLCQMACSPLLLPPFLPHKAFFFFFFLPRAIPGAGDKEWIKKMQAPLFRVYIIVVRKENNSINNRKL